MELLLSTVIYLKFPSVSLTLSWYEICTLSFDSMKIDDPVPTSRLESMVEFTHTPPEFVAYFRSLFVLS